MPSSISQNVGTSKNKKYVWFELVNGRRGRWIGKGFPRCQSWIYEVIQASRPHLDFLQVLLEALSCWLKVWSISLWNGRRLILRNRQQSAPTSRIRIIISHRFAVPGFDLSRMTERGTRLFLSKQISETRRITSSIFLWNSQFCV